MHLYIQQRVFAWTDTYDIYDETGEARYEVRSDFLSLGHQIHVYDKRTGREVGSIREKMMVLRPKFQIIIDGQLMGSVRKEFTFLLPKYEVDYLGWVVEGNILGCRYQVFDGSREVMSIARELFSLGDAYGLEYANPEDEIPGVLLVLAIDAANCTHNK